MTACVKKIKKWGGHKWDFEKWGGHVPPVPSGNYAHDRGYRGKYVELTGVRVSGFKANGDQEEEKILTWSVKEWIDMPIWPEKPDQPLKIGRKMKTPHTVN